MNTEQLKTAEQIYEDNVGSNMELGYIRTPKENVIQAMKIFASQESKRAVDEFKEKLKVVSPDEIRHALQLIQNALEDAPYSLGGLKEAWNLISDNLTKYEDLIDKL